MLKRKINDAPLSSLIDNAVDIDVAWNEWLAKIEQFMSATIPKVRFKSNKATPWFDITNPKRFLTFFKKKIKAKSFPETIFHGSQECSSPRKKANLFNQYFKSNFADDDSTTNPHS